MLLGHPCERVGHLPKGPEPQVENHCSKAVTEGPLWRNNLKSREWAVAQLCCLTVTGRIRLLFKLLERIAFMRGFSVQVIDRSIWMNFSLCYRIGGVFLEGFLTKA